MMRVVVVVFLVVLMGDSSRAMAVVYESSQFALNSELQGF
jgi:hypothetical protein